MTKFNRKRQPARPNTVNLAGGTAYSQSAETELVSILLTSFVQDKAHRSAETELQKLRQLVGQVDPLFAAKAAIYARQEFGMRSITHVLASELVPFIRGQRWAKGFYSKVIRRLDDMSEILSYHALRQGKLHPVPNSMKKGFAEVMSEYYVNPDGSPQRIEKGHFRGQVKFRFMDSNIAKYKGERSEISLVDVVNLAHPNQGRKGDLVNKAWHRLVRNELVIELETAENMMSASGGNVDKKIEGWKKVLLGNSASGYLNIIRNCRNILNLKNEGLTSLLIAAIKNDAAIKASVVMPFQFMTAVDELSSVPGAGAVIDAINVAMDKACSNLPNLPGKTLIAIDESGSMTTRNSSGRSPIDYASIMGAALYKKLGNSDIIMFDERARFYSPSHSDSITTIGREIRRSAHGGGTNFETIFELASRSGIKYDRIFILSDMQSWGHYYTQKSFNAYRAALGVNPKLFSFDFAGYGSLQFPEKNVYSLAGFSDKIFDLIAILDEDRDALINKIKSIKL